MARFTNFKRPGQTTDVYLTDPDVLREKAEARMAMGSGFPDEFVSIHCVQHASLVLSSNHNTLALPVAAN